MAYEKQEFIDGVTVLNAEHLEHMEDGIARIYDDFYDEKEYEKWTLIEGTSNNLLNPGYTATYDVSTFSGWTTCIGKPTGFNVVRFPIKIRENFPITQVVVKILEIPQLEELNFSVPSDSSAKFYPLPSNWKKVAEKTLSFSGNNSLKVGEYNIIECEFDSVINNSDGKYYGLSVICNNIVTMGYIIVDYKDIPFDPWIWYGTNGSSTTNMGVTGSYDSTSKKIKTIACQFFYKFSSNRYITIGTEKKDKFFDLVNDCINNSESLGSIFQKSNRYLYSCGSADLVQGATTKATNGDSTFTGVVFPIGVIPKEIESQGVLLQIQGRSYKESVKPIKKVYAYLYSVDNIPLTDTYKGKSFKDLQPKLLRSGVVNCEINVGQKETIYIQWQEGSFINDEEQFLMLGYECDSYNYRCLVTGSGAHHCGKIDGNTYGSLETWYSTSQEGGQAWRPRWQDTSANAWTFVTTEQYYDLGDKFYNLLNEAIDERLNEEDLNKKVIPTSEVRLAKEYDVVVGDTFQLFYEGVIKGFNVLNDGIFVKFSRQDNATVKVARQYPRYWQFIPQEEDAGKEYSLRILTRQLDGSVISEGQTKIKVHAKLTNDATPTKLTALIFGDSLTSSGAWAAEGFRRIYGEEDSKATGPIALGVSNELKTYGEYTNKINTFTISHEGHSGWTWNSFLTAERGPDSTENGIIITLDSPHNYNLDEVRKSIWQDNNGLLWELEDFPSDKQIKFNRGEGNNKKQKEIETPTSLICNPWELNFSSSAVTWETLNPFYNESTKTLDFKAHANQYGVDSADIVACLLTWNGAGGMSETFNNTSTISNHMNLASQLLKAIHKDFPYAKIICMGIQLSSITGGSGKDYGSKGGYSDTWGSVFYAFDYNQALEKLVTEDSELSQYCYYVDTKGQFDTRYCMSYENIAVNTRVTEVKEMRGTNGVHPSTAGYYQIGDAFYRTLTKVIPIVKEIKGE